MDTAIDQEDAALDEGDAFIDMEDASSRPEDAPSRMEDASIDEVVAAERLKHPSTLEESVDHAQCSVAPA